MKMKLSTTLISMLVTMWKFSVTDGNSTDDSELDLLVITVATDETDGFKRFLRSTKIYDVDVKVFGLGERWEGGNVAQYAGGGHKVNLLKAGLTEYSQQDNLLLMFTDSYDVVFTDGPQLIIEKFLKFGAQVVFSAEGFCWPDQSLAEKYPDVKANEKRYLCSGGFVGYAKDVYDIISYRAIDNKDDDQLYYTNIFLDPVLREKWNIKLDTRSEIFQNLNGAQDDITLKFKGPKSFIYNVATGTTPMVIHGNGPVKVEFNRLANYLADGWSTNYGCHSCMEDLISLQDMSEEDFPTVLLGVFIEKPTPFLPEFLMKIGDLNYPKNKIDLLVHNLVERHQEELSPFFDKFGTVYKSINILNPSDEVSESAGRNWAIEECTKKNCQYLFSVDSECHLDNKDILQLLIQQNRSVIAPLLSRPGKLWSNFWGALSKTGFYARSDDYIDIVERKKIGLWNVPYMTGVYLVQGHLVPGLQDAFTANGGDPDMAFCATLRNQGVFMFLSNRNQFGHLVNCDSYDTSKLHPDMYQLFDNSEDWEKRYMHENYSSGLQTDAVIAQPCPDVYWFPFISEKFTQDLVEEVENYGVWSGGKHEDIRLSTGYENVPTDDVHMNQIGFESHWLEVLRKYVQPLQQKVFIGYFRDPPHALLNFMVKYTPDRQRSLRPHHDSSTYTINVALNTPGTDFEGGGCRFLRYNCSVVATRKGWMIMHPGRLTHYHEGLTVTKGTRYIMVSFVDP